MAIELPYYPRKYTSEWLETLRFDTGVFTDQDLEIYGHGCFPDSDGEPLGETDWHVTALFQVLDMLKRHFAEQPDVYVAAENFIYWKPRTAKACVCPDVYIVKGAGMRPRRSFKIWEESGLTPNVVFEFTSKGTKEKDFEEKMFLFERELIVPEYFLFDPEHVFLDPQLSGFRLTDGAYEPIPMHDGRLYSEQLDLNLAADGVSLRFIVPATGERILLPAELAQRADAERERADTEAKARLDAESEVARLMAELNALRGR